MEAPFPDNPEIDRIIAEAHRIRLEGVREQMNIMIVASMIYEVEEIE